jgi:hypothetical protein
MDELDSVNEPIALPGAGTGGARGISASDELRRRNTMLGLLKNMVGDDVIVRVMQQEFNMTDSESEVLKQQVLERALSESEHRKPYKKSLAEQRISDHIAKAAKRGAYGAVAALEGQLARIQGTEEATETKVTVNARLQTATLHILQGMPQEQIDELIAEELAIASLPGNVR